MAVYLFKAVPEDVDLEDIELDGDREEVLIWLRLLVAAAAHGVLSVCRVRRVVIALDRTVQVADASSHKRK